MIKLLKKNKKYLNFYCKNYKKFIGKELHGVTISYSGLLACLHLAGIGNVKKFLTKGYNATDGNASVKSYMNEFKNYNLENII